MSKIDLSPDKIAALLEIYADIFTVQKEYRCADEARAVAKALRGLEPGEWCPQHGVTDHDTRYCPIQALYALGPVEVEDEK